MTNLVLFVATTIIYTVAVASLLAWDDIREWGGSFWGEMREMFVGEYKEALQALGIVALLCLPLNINGNVFTVLGNVHSTGVKNIYSVFSVYQNAEYNAYSLFGALCQKADKGNANIIFGVSLCQEAGSRSLTWVGLNGWQSSKNSGVLVGVSLFQRAREKSVIGLGVALIQESKNSIVSLGASIRQYGSESAKTDMGLAIIQSSERVSTSNLAMSIYQRAGNQSRAFAVWSKLQTK